VIVFRSYRALQNEQKLSLPSMVGLHKRRRLRNKKKHIGTQHFTAKMIEVQHKSYWSQARALV
jgi:hypothetical protein